MHVTISIRDTRTKMFTIVMNLVTNHVSEDKEPIYEVLNKYFKK